MNALVPVKALTDAKSRLAKSLTNMERKKLVLRMLDHVISILQSVHEIEKISIVTPDEEVLSHAAVLGVVGIPEVSPGHNPSLTAASQHENTKSLLTISADLPLLNAANISQMIVLSQQNDIVLAPSKDLGTNAIIMTPPLIIPYLFGTRSFEKYKRQADKQTLSVGIYHNETIAFDVDTIDDLQTLQSLTTNH